MTLHLAAVLIVKDEAACLDACLTSLAGVADQIVVHDTGSTDDTVSIARRHGVQVSRGTWSHDFATARNAALSECTADWVLSVDADELVIGNRDALDQALADVTNDVFTIEMQIDHDEGPYAVRVARLFRRIAVRWEGRVHERLVGSKMPTLALPSDVLRMEHRGYFTLADRAARARRNAALAKQAIADDPNDALAYVDLGRSLVALGESQRAADAFEKARSLRASGPEWLEATDFLTRLVLAEGMPDAALVLVQQLSEAGAQREYCDWIAAQALVQQHRFADAAALLRDVYAVADTSGRVYAAAALDELKSLVNRLASAT